MGFTEITDGTDLQSVSFVNEYRRALMERRLATNVSSGHDLSDIEAGRDLQTIGLFNNFWLAIVAMRVHYVDHELYPNGYIPSGPHYKPWYLTDERLWAAAGIPNGPRFATTWPANWRDYHDPAYGYRFGIYPGDILGPWIWADLQAVIKCLRWTWMPAYWVTAGEANYKRVLGREPIGGNWADVQAEAEANYAAAAPVELLQYVNVSYSYFYSSGPSEKIAEIYRSYAYRRITGVPTHRPCDVWFYSNPIRAVGTFDDNGDDLTESGTQQLIDIVPNSQAETVLSRRIGGSMDVVPHPPAQYPPPSGGPPFPPGEQRGYHIYLDSHYQMNCPAYLKWHFDYA